MKVQSLVVATVVAVAAVLSPVSVSAVECTDAQLTALDASNTTSAEQACPSLFADGDSIDPSRMGTFTADSLKALAPCKDTKCLAELDNIMKLVPNCTVAGIDLPGFYGASVKLCKAFAAGDVTVDKATEIFKDVAKNLTSAFEDIFAGSDSSSSELPSMTKPAKANASAPSTTPAPSATKSNANTIVVAGVAIATTVATTLLL